MSGTSVSQINFQSNGRGGGTGWQGGGEEDGGVGGGSVD